MTIIYTILMLSFLIFFHELGHFMAAKFCGVRVNEFAVGMGPKLLKYQKGETLYSVRAFPIGGFCAMEGEDEESEDPRAFNNKKTWQKSIIIVAGAFMNLVIALVLVATISYMKGEPTLEINQVIENTPAYEVGILKGDKLLSINGEKISSWEDMLEKKNKIADSTPIKLEVIRNDKNLELDLGTIKKSENGEIIIGILPTVEKNLISSITSSPSKTLKMTGEMYRGLGKLVIGKISTKEISGPIGIIYIMNQNISQGLVMILTLMAVISLNLAVINMLPLPALDGGRLIMTWIRKITGKAISDKVEGYIHATGMILILGLTIYVTYNDIWKFIVPIFK